MEEKCKKVWWLEGMNCRAVCTGSACTGDEQRLESLDVSKDVSGCSGWGHESGEAPIRAMTTTLPCGDVRASPYPALKESMSGEASNDELESIPLASIPLVVEAQG